MNTCWNKAPSLFQCAQGALSISEILLHQNPAIYENRENLKYRTECTICLREIQTRHPNT